MPQPCCDWELVGTQTPFELQQPLLQVASQGRPPSLLPPPPPLPPPEPPPAPKVVQEPRVQTWLKLHAWQAAPETPHSWLLLPAWHRPALSQQPLAQVEALQVVELPHESAIPTAPDMAPTRRMTRPSFINRYSLCGGVSPDPAAALENRAASYTALARRDRRGDA